MTLRWLLLGLAAGLLSPALLLAEDPPANDAEQEILTRAIARRDIGADGKVAGLLAAQLKGKAATAINYKVMAYGEGGKLSCVDERNHVFRLNQRFMLELETFNDVYIYVYYIDSQNNAALLLPDAKRGEKEVFVKKGRKVTLPNDGTTTFQFEAPAGVDRLVVFASPTPRAGWVPPEASVDMEKRTPEQKEKLLDNLQKVTAEFRTRSFGNWKQVAVAAREESPAAPSDQALAGKQAPRKDDVARADPPTKDAPPAKQEPRVAQTDPPKPKAEPKVATKPPEKGAKPALAPKLSPFDGRMVVAMTDKERVRPELRQEIVLRVQ